MGCNQPSPSNTVSLSFPVTNQSSQAATLEIVNPVSGAPVGNITPAVIPPNGQTTVVVEVPIDRAWVVYVNHGSANGGPAIGGSDLVGCSGDVPIEVFIDPAGEPAWQAPDGGWCGGLE